MSEQAIKKLLLLSSLSVSAVFLTIKILWFSLGSHGASEKPKLVQENVQASYIFPLLVNLKGERGPQLARIHVHVTLSADSREKEFLSHDSQLEKHLLFILSGQSIEVLNRKKEYFEKQILSQLNAFLTQNPVNGIHIQTEILN